MSELASGKRLKLAPKARVRFDARDEKWVLLSPERGLVLNESAARVVELCDGTRTVDAIVDALVAAHDGDRATIARDVDDLVAMLRARALIVEV